jgi:hypothetical protein
VSTSTKPAGVLREVQINVKTKLSALWVALMFCYTYADILGFYAPGNLEELLAGRIAGIQMTQGMLFIWHAFKWPKLDTQNGTRRKR